MILLKGCTQYASKFGKHISSYRTGKRLFSFQCQSKPMPKNAQTNKCTIALISDASKLILKILQAWLQQHVSWELPDIQVGFRKGKGTSDQIANIRWVIEEARKFLENIYLCFIDYTKTLDCMDHNRLQNSLRDGNPRPYYLPSEELVCRSRSNRTEHGTMDWFQIGKAVHQGCIFSPCLFNLFAEYCSVFSHSVMSNSATPWTVASQDPLSMVILQAKILEWVAMPTSMGSLQQRDTAQFSCIAGGFFTVWATKEVQ